MAHVTIDTRFSRYVTSECGGTPSEKIKYLLPFMETCEEFVLIGLSPSADTVINRSDMNDFTRMIETFFTNVAIKNEKPKIPQTVQMHGRTYQLVE